MTSFYPKTRQSFDDLKAKPPAPLVHLGHADRSVPVELFWLGMSDNHRGQALAVGRHDEHGVELTRHINDDPNEILQVLADAWGCELVSEYGNERFIPGQQARTPLVYKTEHGVWRCVDCSMYGGRDGYPAKDANDMLEHLRLHQQVGEKLPEKELHALLWEFWEATRGLRPGEVE